MRPDIDRYFLAMAHLVATRATCRRRMVGCVLVNQRHHVLATGYNGNAAGLSHCLDHPCPGAAATPGTQLDLCEAIHAEANALLQCRDPYQIATAYTTVSPCVGCVKLLLNTSCQRLVYAAAYPHPDALDLWRRAGRRAEVRCDVVCFQRLQAVMTAATL